MSPGQLKIPKPLQINYLNMIQNDIDNKEIQR